MTPLEGAAQLRGALDRYEDDRGPVTWSELQAVMWQVLNGANGTYSGLIADDQCPNCLDAIPRSQLSAFGGICKGCALSEIGGGCEGVGSANARDLDDFVPQICSRVNHACGFPGAGPCNGFPRHNHAPGETKPLCVACEQGMPPDPPRGVR